MDEGELEMKLNEREMIEIDLKSMEMTDKTRMEVN